MSAALLVPTDPWERLLASIVRPVPTPGQVRRERYLARIIDIAARVDAHQVTGWTRDPARAGGDMGFLLGVHRGRWLQDQKGLPGVPMYLSAHVLQEYASRGDDFPKGQVPAWGIDSGGFTELKHHGTWRAGADEYGGMITRFMEDVGTPPLFVSPQDWMCEPWVIEGGVHDGQRFVGTGLTLRDHLELTVENFCYLRQEFPYVPWAPVLQGWQLDDYELCYQMFAEAGVNLAAEPLVGLGSVCRRQATSEIGQIVQTFHARGLRMHGFGVKADGLRLYGHMLVSADSMAWSRVARSDRDDIRLPGCEHKGNCNNCLRWALVWRELVLQALRERPVLPAQRERGRSVPVDPWHFVLDS
ncbi:hypothetical protein KBX50_08395 [Micromonospora sp. C51]|uniref:deazapurine DNA modification protein DpdA family protein n=1 Tax=Micromonospora sp. C51 TaxID=2824879 RepID=UPI001B36A23D|nr:hypothetical protein [Micromonospora sp. C51]MBQ1048482.1 hypothetical protein [Micromonospora sp. C51]